MARGPPAQHSWYPSRVKVSEVLRLLAEGGTQAMNYLVILEPTETGFSAYSPDLPGCVATGATQSDVEQAMLEAIEFHLEGLRAEGLEVPPARTTATYLHVAA